MPTVKPGRGNVLVRGCFAALGIPTCEAICPKVKDES